MRISVDESRCIGCGMCAYAAPGVFRIVGRYSTVLEKPDETQLKRAKNAEGGCPVNAITVEK